MRDRLDDESIISREVEERARFAGRAEFGEDVFGSQGEKVVGWIEVEMFVAKISEYPRCVVLELEVISRGRCELVSDTGRVSAMPNHPLWTTHMSKENLCRAPKSSSVRGRLTFA